MHRFDDDLLVQSEMHPACSHLSRITAMNTTPTSARPLTLLGIAVSTIAAGGILGAMTNAVNGAVSPTYFRNVLRWHHVEHLWRAAVAQGIFEGLIYGVLFAFVFTLVVAVASRARATFGFAIRYVLLACAIALTMWCAGGVLAMGLAALSPDFFRSAFIGVPAEFGEMLRYAWVGGSIWGAMLGGLLSVVIVSSVAAVSWQRRAQIV
jgi:hypothetical protein